MSQGSTLGLLFFLIYINDMSQAVDSDLLLYADDTCLVFQHNDIRFLFAKSRFFNLNWLVIDNKLSLHFGEEEKKSILFSPKRKSRTTGQIDISYKDVKIKQYAKVTYLRCALHKCLTWESMAMQVYTKISSKLKFLTLKRPGGEGAG